MKPGMHSIRRNQGAYRSGLGGPTPLLGVGDYPVSVGGWGGGVSGNLHLTAHRGGVGIVTTEQTCKVLQTEPSFWY